MEPCTRAQKYRRIDDLTNPSIYISILIPFQLSAPPYRFPHSSIRRRITVLSLSLMSSVAAAQFSAAIVVLLFRYVVFLSLCFVLFFLLSLWDMKRHLVPFFSLLSTVNVHTLKKKKRRREVLFALEISGWNCISTLFVLCFLSFTYPSLSLAPPNIYVVSLWWYYSSFSSQRWCNFLLEVQIWLSVVFLDVMKGEMCWDLFFCHLQEENECVSSERFFCARSQKGSFLPWNL